MKPKKLLALLAVIAIAAPSSAVGGIGATFKDIRPSKVEVGEVWLGTVGVSGDSDCTDQDYLDTTQVLHTSTSAPKKITYNGTGCDTDPGSPSHNHLVLGKGWYRVILSAWQTDDTSTLDCRPAVYTGATGMSLVVQVANQSKAIALVQVASTMNLIPWTSICTGNANEMQMNLMVERLDL